KGISPVDIKTRKRASMTRTPSKKLYSKLDSLSMPGMKFGLMSTNEAIFIVYKMRLDSIYTREETRFDDDHMGFFSKS
ncbi:hypothetical protein CEXT_66221, partial [Caerostris extrusa]